MKFYVLFICLFALATGKNIFPRYGEYEDGQRYFFMDDEDGNIFLVDTQEKYDVEPRFDATKDTVLFLYTRKNRNNPDVIRKGDLTQFYGSHLDVTKPVKIVIHGWNNDWESRINNEITTAYLDNMDVNVIFVDWSAGGGTILYPLAVSRVPYVGQFIAYVIDWLVVNDVPLNNIHIMGHSLGAHVSGIAARNVKSGTLRRVTAFDPALPLWGAGSERLRKTDAEYVEVIHTNGGNLGIMEPIGNNDFYPNGGKGQTGCGLIGISCSHSRSYEFYASSLDHTGFMSSHCDSIKDAEKGNCDGPQLHMGGTPAKPTMGIFYLETYPNKPYYKG